MSLSAIIYIRKENILNRIEIATKLCVNRDRFEYKTN